MAKSNKPNGTGVAERLADLESRVEEIEKDTADASGALERVHRLAKRVAELEDGIEEALQALEEQGCDKAADILDDLLPEDADDGGQDD